MSRLKPCIALHKFPNFIRLSILCAQTHSTPLQHALISPEHNKFRSSTMLYWAGVFFIIAIIAAIFGFGGIAAGAASIAKILFFIFIVLFLLSLIFGIGRRGRPSV
jgi:uncharacterized membrane protein YtjA (UPF0391 family)